MEIAMDPNLALKRVPLLVALVSCPLCVRSASSGEIAGAVAYAWPNGRTSNHVPALAVDKDLGTFTWSTEAFNTLVGNVGLDFAAPALVNRIRLWKDPDRGGPRTPIPKNLTILYTTDTGAMESRVWSAVEGLRNGLHDSELLRAGAVNLDGTVDGDVHDSVNGTDGWASLVFFPVEATGVAIRFANPPDSTYQYVHYKVHELEAHFDDPTSVPGSVRSVSWGSCKGGYAGR
jgi:hypothetical protein